MEFLKKVLGTRRGKVALFVELCIVLLLVILFFTMRSAAWFDYSGTSKEAKIGTGQVMYDLVSDAAFELATDGAVKIFQTRFNITTDRGNYEDEDATGAAIVVTDSGIVGINGYPYLPGNSELLLAPLRFTNNSTVDTKIRLKIAWEYSPIDETTPTAIGVDTLSLGGITARKDIASGNGPLVASLPACWYNAKNQGQFVMRTTGSAQNVDWNITKVTLTPEEKALNGDALATALSNLNTNFVDAGEAYFYYETDSSAIAGYTVDENGNIDYGGAIQAVGEGEPRQEILVLDQLIVDPSYTTYSKQKKFSVTVTFQARQSDFFVMGAQGGSDAWYDVFTASISGDGQ